MTRSHEVLDVGFKGKNEIDLTVPRKLQCPFGIKGLTVELEPIGKNKYNVILLSELLDTQKMQVDFLEKFSEHFSFLINLKESSPNYGNIFVKVEWNEFVVCQESKTNEAFNDNVYASDSIGLKSTRPVNLDESDWQNTSYHDLHRFYFDGLRAGHKKSKYFHWFLVFEYLENSDKYKSLFNHNKLFCAEERQAISEMADTMSDDTKKGALKHLLSRTKEPRSVKLLQMLEYFEIHSYRSMSTERELTEDIVKSIINGRNSIFHTGSDFPESTLWFDLFPIATLVVEKVAKNPAILES